MRVQEIRLQFLSEHAQLRGKVSVLQSLALSVLRGDEELASALRLKGEDLQKHLHRHMAWEEKNLLPALERTPGLIGTISAALLEEHQTQRDRLAKSLKLLESSESRPKELARSIMELISWIETDMVSEEKAVLAALATEAKASCPTDAFEGSS